MSSPETLCNLTSKSLSGASIATVRLGLGQNVGSQEARSARCVCNHVCRSLDHLDIISNLEKATYDIRAVCSVRSDGRVDGDLRGLKLKVRSSASKTLTAALPTPRVSLTVAVSRQHDVLTQTHAIYQSSRSSLEVFAYTFK